MKFETNSLSEVEFCERLAKNVKWFNAFTSVLDTGLITLTVITGNDSIAEFVIGSGLPVRNALSETSATANHKNSLKHLP